MLQIGDNLNENGQCANFRWGQCYRGKSRGGEVRLCTQWSNGNISAGKGQLFGRHPHWTILQFSFAYKSSSHPTPRVIVFYFLSYTKDKIFGATILYAIHIYTYIETFSI